MSSGKNSLAGKTIWVTRPKAQAQGLSEMIRQVGGEAFCLPVMDIEPCEVRPTDIETVQNLDHFHQLIFVSTNAVKYGMELVAQYWPQWPVGIQWWAVGKATARALNTYGLEAKTPDRSFNSEGLLGEKDLTHVYDQNILIIRGQNGLNLLPETLKARGADVSLLEVYKRLPGKPSDEELEKLGKLILQNQLDALIITSVEALGNAREIVVGHNLDISKLFLVVISERIAAEAKKAGFQNIKVATGAGDEEILKALIHSFT